MQWFNSSNLKDGISYGFTFFESGASLNVEDVANIFLIAHGNQSSSGLLKQQRHFTGSLINLNFGSDLLACPELQLTQQAMRCMAESHQLKQLFATRGPLIEVYSAAQPELKPASNVLRLVPIGQIPIPKSKHGFSVHPTKMLLNESEQRAMILGEMEGVQITEVDLGEGRVVRELRLEGGSEESIRDFCYEKKVQEYAGCRLINCINHRSIYKLDPRIQKSQVIQQPLEQKCYSQDQKFTCLAVDAEGHVAVGNELGEVRLYQKIGQSAKVLYPGIGKPVRFLDMSSDGHYIAATSTSCILLYCNSSSLNCNAICPAQAKEPHVLKLLPSDKKRYQLKKAQFTAAKLDCECSQVKENYIIASVGRCSVIWNIERVLAGKKPCYQILEMPDEVKAVQFAHSSSKQAFALLEADICAFATSL